MKPISSVLVLMDYRDNQERHVLTAVYYGQKDRESNLPLRSQAGWGIRKLEHGLSPGESYTLSFTSDFVARNCASEAVLTRVSLTFSDGSRLETSAPQWKTDPVIMETRHTDLATFPASAPDRFVARMHVNSNGKADVQDSDGGASTKTWLQDQIDKWLILPPEHGPSASGDELITLNVIVHKDSVSRKLSPHLVDRVRTYMVVEMWPTKEPGLGRVLIGGLPATQYALPLEK